MKELETTPWYICNEEDTNYCAYMDTDSVYIHAEPILRYLYPNFDTMSDEQKDEALEKIALKYQDIITTSYDTLAENCFNVKSHRLEMKTECVIRSAYFRATRRYAQWITKQEGVTLKNKTPKKPKDKGVVGTDNGGQSEGDPLDVGVLDIKGLEFKKANFPPILGKFFMGILEDVLKGTPKSEIDERVKSFQQQILDGTLPLKDLGNPQSVKKLDKYVSHGPRAGEMFSTLEKGATAAIKATVAYNDLLRFWKLNTQYPYITQGSKIKWIYLKSNPYQLESIAFMPGADIPPKINDFIEEYADRKKIFDSILLNKLDGFFDDLGWVLNLNPYQQMFFNF
mgnify:CR=1 FL=1